MDCLSFAFYEHLSESLLHYEVVRLKGVFSSSRTRFWEQLAVAKSDETRSDVQITLKSVNNAVYAYHRTGNCINLLLKRNLQEEGTRNVRFDHVAIWGPMNGPFANIEEEQFVPLEDLQPQLRFIVSRLTRECAFTIHKNASEVFRFSDLFRICPFLKEFLFSRVCLAGGIEESIFEFLEFQVNQGKLDGISLEGEWPNETDDLLRKAVGQEQLQYLYIPELKNDVSQRLLEMCTHKWPDRRAQYELPDPEEDF